MRTYRHKENGYIMFVKNEIIAKKVKENIEQGIKTTRSPIAKCFFGYSWERPMKPVDNGNKEIPETSQMMHHKYVYFINSRAKFRFFG